MLSHRGRRRASRLSLFSRLKSARVRAVLSLGIVLGFGAVSTMAYWTDEATIKSGTFTAGKLDLTVGATIGASDNLPGQGGTHPYSTLTISNLVPGESIARPFVVRNFGNVGFTFNGSVYTTNNDLLAAGSGLRVAIYLGGTPTETGTEIAGNRSGVCSGGVLLKDQAVSTSTNTINVSPTPILLASGTTQSHCVRVLLDQASPNTLQGKITQIVVKFNAKQVSAP